MSTTMIDETTTERGRSHDDVAAMAVTVLRDAFVARERSLDGETDDEAPRDQIDIDIERFAAGDLAKRPPVTVPNADAFGFDDYLKASHLDALASWCLERYPELADARRATIAYRWKRKGGASQGQAVLGKCTKLTGFVFQEVRCQYLIWLAADHVATEGLSQRQIEALLYHELSHIVLNEDDETGAESWGVVGHDFNGFLAEYRRFGGWHGGIAAIEHEVRQQPLPGMEGER